MFILVKMVPRVIIKKVATFPPFAGADLDRYTAALDVLESDSEIYLTLLSNDEVATAPSDVFDMRNHIRSMQQSAFFGFLDVLEEVRDYVAAKVVPPAEPPEPVAEDEQPEEEHEHGQEDGSESPEEELA